MRCLTASRVALLLVRDATRSLLPRKGTSFAQRLPLGEDRAPLGVHDCVSPSEKTREIEDRVYANAHAAAFHLFSGTGNAIPQATAFLNTAKANLKRANEREQLYIIAAIDAWIKRDTRKAMPYGKPSRAPSSLPLTRLRSSQSYC